MKFYSTLTLLFITSIAISQDFEITGKLVDEAGTPLESATIYLEKAEDSSVVTYTISEKNGSFRLTGNTKAPKLDMYVSFAGFQPHKTTLDIKDKMELPTINMKIQDNELEEVVVNATRAPITIKKRYFGI